MTTSETIPSATIASVRPSCASRRCSGVGFAATDCSELAILPSCVCIPIAVITAWPWP